MKVVNGTVGKALEAFQLANGQLMISPSGEVYRQSIKRLHRIASRRLEDIEIKDLIIYVETATSGPATTSRDLAVLHLVAAAGGVDLPTPHMVEVTMRGQQFQSAGGPIPKYLYQALTCRPGDLGKFGDTGKRFKLLNGYSGAFNRDISKDHARYLMQNWETVVEETVLVLIPDPAEPGTFFVLDGQNRLYGASELCKTPTTFQVQVRDPVQFRSTIAEQVAHLNLGKKFRTADHLKNSHQQSWWPAAFEANQLFPGPGKGHTTLNWPSILQGVIIAKMARSMGSAKTSNTNALRDLWLTQDPTMLAEMGRIASIIAWWREADEGASARKIFTLHSGTGLAFALLLYEQNSDNLKLSEVPARLLQWPELPNIRNFTAGRGGALFKELLDGVNYNLKKNLFTVLGSTGRDLVPPANIPELPVHSSLDFGGGSGGTADLEYDPVPASRLTVVS